MRHAVCKTSVSMQEGSHKILTEYKFEFILLSKTLELSCPIAYYAEFLDEFGSSIFTSGLTTFTCLYFFLSLFSK